MSTRQMSDLPGPPFWFKIAAGVFVLVVAIAFLCIFWPCSTPGGTLNAYIGALAGGRCDKAYDMVSYYAKKKYDGCSTYDNFQRNTCAPVAVKYVFLDLFHVEDTAVNGSGDEASVLARLKYKAPWMPKSQFRTTEFILRREGGHWLLDGPVLQP
jgi:hypothetical protein